MYSVELKPQAQKFIEAQSKKIQQQLIKRIEILATNPHPPQSKLLHAGEALYSYRSGVYRIIYQIQEKNLLIVVAKIGHRKNVYKRLAD
jgi:mRNA interferase RelE/StbE